MAKPMKTSNTNDDIELIKSDVASFASSLGLASSAPSSGFNDTDFRKPSHSKPKTKKKPEKKPEKKSPIAEPKKPETPKPKPKPSVLSLDEKGSSGHERFKSLPKLPLMKPSAVGVWYSAAEELEEKLIGKEAVAGAGAGAGAGGLEEWKRVVAEKKELGERLMAQFAKDYESSRGQSGDIKMLYASMRSGTEKDKVSAFSVLVGDNPVANLRAIDALLGLVATKVGKNRAVMGFDALKELFVSSLLPDRKLKTLFQQPLKQLPENKDGYSLLLLWHWEECLKQRYERFVGSLEQASKDVLPHLKDKAVKIIYALLNSKAEQERKLLTALVNKLGDPKGASASNAAHHLTKLLSQAEHPNMRAVVINEVDTFLFRPHLELRAKYHAVNFLSQIYLSNRGDGPKVAKRLIDVYFALFKVVITETGSTEEKDKTGKHKDKTGKQKDKTGKPSNLKASKSKQEITVDSHADWTTLLSAILTGVNRAFPYVSTSEADDIIESQTPVLFQLVHSDNFNVGIQALRLLHKITSKNQIASDRFYRALYGKLLLPASVQSSKVEMFIALLSAAMKTDTNLKRLAAFAKRLLQVALQQQPQYACGYLFLLSEVLKSRPGLGQMVRQSELVDEEDEHFEDIIEEDDEKKPKPAEKQAGPVENGRASTISGEVDSEDDDDIPVSLSDDEASDAEDDAEDDDFVVRGDSENATESGKLSVPENQFSKSSKRCELPGGYEPRHREPAFCNADRTGWWELTVLASHVHPSVSNWANRLLLGSDIIYSGDPVKDLSLPAFLDKFMEKKPKSSSWHGGSQIEPSKKLDMSNHLIGPEILSLADEDVPPEDLVFHKFYMNKQNSSKKPKKKNKKKKKKQSEEDDDDLLGDDGQEDESDNEEIENLLDSVDRSIEPDDAGEYDYDDLDRVAGEDDDNDLVDDNDDEDDDLPSDMGEDFDFGDDESLDGDIDDEDDDDAIEIGDADDGEDNGEDEDEDEDEDEQPKKKRKDEQPKRKRKAGASPFASLDEYEHLLKDDGGEDDGVGSDDDVDEKEEPKEKKKHKKSKSRKNKKRKPSE